MRHAVARYNRKSSATGEQFSRLNSGCSAERRSASGIRITPRRGALPVLKLRKKYCVTTKDMVV